MAIKPGDTLEWTPAEGGHVSTNGDYRLWENTATGNWFIYRGTGLASNALIMARYNLADAQQYAQEDSDRQARLCGYSLAHKIRGIPATTTIDCGPVGKVNACQACADFYARMG